MIKILDRIKATVALGSEGVSLSWISAIDGKDTGKGRLVHSSGLKSPWDFSAESIDALRAMSDETSMEDQNITLSIPDSEGFVSVLNFGAFPASMEERMALVKWTLSRNTNIPEKDLIVDYHILSEGSGGGVKALTVAIETKVMGKYEDSMKDAGLNVWSAGLRSIHALNSLEVTVGDCKNFVVFYYGETYFTIIVFKDGCVDFIRTKKGAKENTLSREVSATIQSYRGSNTDYTYEKFIVIGDVADKLGIEGAVQARVIGEDGSEEVITPLKASSVGSLKS